MSVLTTSQRRGEEGKENRAVLHFLKNSERNGVPHEKVAKATLWCSAQTGAPGSQQPGLGNPLPNPLRLGGLTMWRFYHRNNEVLSHIERVSTPTLCT